MSFHDRMMAALDYSGEVSDIRIHEGFEGIGTPSGWGTTNVNYDYETTVIDGLQSMHLPASNSLASSPVFTEIDGTTYIFLGINTPMDQASQGFIDVFSGGSRMFRLRVLSAGTIRMYKADGSTTHATSNSNSLVVANTTKWVWIEYTAGTGTDAVTAVYAADTPTKPGSPILSNSTLEATGNCDQVKCTPVQSGATMIIDNLIVSAAVIGSDPF